MVNETGGRDRRICRKVTSKLYSGRNKRDPTSNRVEAENCERLSSNLYTQAVAHSLWHVCTPTHTCIHAIDLFF